MTGIGGFFFRTPDPERITAWYAQHLGGDAPPPSYDTSSWWQQPGPTSSRGRTGVSTSEPSDRWGPAGEHQ